jgi:hypothetical protein
MIGVIRSICPGATVDLIAVDVPAHDIRRGAWALLQAAPFYPPDTIHVGVVDPGVGTNRRKIVIESQQGIFIGPDNGLFSWAVDQESIRTVTELSNPAYRLSSHDVTFDGRDCFAPAAAHLACGVALEEFGPMVDGAIESIAWPHAERSSGSVDGEVLIEESFGNLVTNIPYDLIAAEFGEDRILIRLDDQPVGRLVAGYADIKEPLGAVINGTGLLEIAGHRTSAASLTGAGPGTRVSVQAEGGTE